MKKFILLDVGTHMGQSISHFKNSQVFKKHDWLIYGFEPHPLLHNKACLTHPELATNIQQLAVWIHNNGINFYQGSEQLGESHSVMLGKKTGNLDYKQPLTVNTIDFSNWVQNNFTRNDFIILKMDIEGAEYDVLEKMIKDNSITFISMLFIEWHSHKLKGFNQQRHINLVNKLKKYKNIKFILTEKQLKRGQNWFTCFNNPQISKLIEN